MKQLIEKYFNCETTLEEEQLLHDYFSGSNIDPELQVYAPLFRYEQQQSDEQLSDSFDERILSMIQEQPVVKARTLSMAQRFAPFLRAAAVVLFVVLLGNGLQTAFNQPVENTTATIGQPQTGNNVAMTDTMTIK